MNGAMLLPPHTFMAGAGTTFPFPNFDVVLTVHLSIILVINQLNA